MQATGQAGAFGACTKHALGGGRAADIAHANEQDGSFGHGQ